MFNNNKLIKYIKANNLSLHKEIFTCRIFDTNYFLKYLHKDDKITVYEQKYETMQIIGNVYENILHLHNFQNYSIISELLIDVEEKVDRYVLFNNLQKNLDCKHLIVKKTKI